MKNNPNIGIGMAEFGNGGKMGGIDEIWSRRNNQRCIGRKVSWNRRLDETGNSVVQPDSGATVSLVSAFPSSWTPWSSIPEMHLYFITLFSFLPTVALEGE